MGEGQGGRRNWDRRGTGGRNYFQWSGMCQCVGSSTGAGQGFRQEMVRTIRFGMYNIQNGRNGGLEAAL